MTTWRDIQAETFASEHIGSTEKRVDSAVFRAVKDRIRGRVLDVGCGDGGVVATLLDAGVEAAGLDLSEVIVVAKARHPKAKFIAVDLWAPYSMPAIQEALAPGRWPVCETVICMDVVEHVEDDIGLLERLAQIAPRVILTTPSNPEKWREQREHLRFYIPCAMARIIALAGMVMVEHLPVVEEDTNLFVAERSDLPLEERLRLSVAAAREPPTSMRGYSTLVNDYVAMFSRLNPNLPDWDAEVWTRAYAAIGEMLPRVRAPNNCVEVIGACGGVLAQALLAGGASVVVVDKDLWALAVARTRIREHPKARYAVGDPCSQVLESSGGVVVCQGVLETEVDDLSVVAACRASLAQGGVGVFIAVHPSTSVPKDGEKMRVQALITVGGPAFVHGRMRDYDEARMRALLEPFFEVLETRVVAGKDHEGREHALVVAVGRRA